jgi:hypothetical protein
MHSDLRRFRVSNRYCTRPAPREARMLSTPLAQNVSRRRPDESFRLSARRLEPSVHRWTLDAATNAAEIGAKVALATPSDGVNQGT